MEAGYGETRDNYLRDNEIDTYFIVPPPHRRKPLILNTLGVRSALGAANRRKLSFRNVSNVVVQLLHSIKYSVPVPFSHMTHPASYPGSTATTGSSLADKSHRKVSGGTFGGMDLWWTCSMCGGRRWKMEFSFLCEDLGALSLLLSFVLSLSRCLKFAC